MDKWYSYCLACGCVSVVLVTGGQDAISICGCGIERKFFKIWSDQELISLPEEADAPTIIVQD